MTESVSRRNVLKWTGALAAAGVVGIGLGFGGDLLLRPNTTKTVTQNSTGTVTQTATQTMTQTATATQTTTATVTQPPTTITTTASATTPQEVLLTSAHDGGPFLAHIVNGVWTKCSPLEPNIPVAWNAYAVRNRVMSPDRIRYPMQRVDFSTSSRNQQNRGKSQYMRISWDSATTLIANELTRVKSTYGNSAILYQSVGHQWPMTFNKGGSWAANFNALFGGCTTVVGSSSMTGSNPASNMMLGSTSYLSTAETINNTYDVITNSKLVIYWGHDASQGSYIHHITDLMAQQLKANGAKQIVIDSYRYNGTATVYADQFISPLPGTDEALMAAIANVWITNSTYNQAFLTKYTYGFQQFHDYIMGVSDGVPKTPAWASPICGVDPTTITTLAQQWASTPTFLYGWHREGAERRDFACEHSRMEMALCAMQGIGPGSGFGIPAYAEYTLGAGQAAFGSIPSVTNPVTQVIRDGNFANCILSPPQSWTTAERHNYVVAQETYPLTGNSQVHLIHIGDGSGGGLLNQKPGMNPKIGAFQSSSIEFVYCVTAFWEASPKFSDVILPVATLGEMDDIINWENYAVYMNTLSPPVGESMSDFNIYSSLASKLGFQSQLTTGLTADQWLANLYASAKYTTSLSAFKAAGYMKFQFDTTPAITAPFSNFLADPVANKLSTTSGLFEIYSQAVYKYFGDNTANAPPIPKYIPGPENLATATSKYPILVMSTHPKFGRHSQWQNLTWLRDEPQMFINGYKAMQINPVDAQARNITNGTVVRVFNDRGQILAAAYLTNKMRPSTISVAEGGWYTPQQPGVANSLDLGGNVNLLIDSRQPEPLCDGMVNSALVQVEVWSGATTS